MSKYAVWDEEVGGFVLGHGILYDPEEEADDRSQHRFVGVTDEAGGWNRVASRTKDLWLHALGPGKLVFIPDGPVR